ncbi:MAG: hypothetical protein M1816_002043 [Peltula sp. TS41687]|nr:MAG: hypothetical protein M1816_002043 [Peltula sp. TS41687]
MRRLIPIITSVLLGAVAVAALPAAPPFGPWGPFVLWNQEFPSYTPPDIGPKPGEANFLDDVPGINSPQRNSLKERYRYYYYKALEEIADAYPEYPPPPEYAEKMKEDIQAKMDLTIKRAQKKILEGEMATSPETGTPVTRATADAQEIRQELRKAQALLDESIERGCSARENVQEKKKEFVDAKAQAYKCRVERNRITAKIRTLTKKLEALQKNRTSEGTEDPGKPIEFSLQGLQDDAKGWSQHAEDRANENTGKPGKPNEFSLQGLQDGAKAWSQRAGGFVQDVMHRASSSGQLTGASANFRPYGAFPKLSPVLP